MKASEIVIQANNLTDESYDYPSAMGFVNAAISEVNAELNANFPRVTLADEEIPFPEMWQDLVLIPYVSAKIKQKDSSQFEYSDLYGQFTNNLAKMKSKYSVPDEYKGETTDSYAPDYTGHYNLW